MDPIHSEVQFKVRHLLVSNVTGHFKNFDATVETEGNDITTAKVHFEAAVDSISTNNEQRDGHLKSPDFLDVEKFPTITFKSVSVRVTGSGEHEVTGELTIHGVTKVVTLAVDGPSAPAKDPWGNMRIGLSATGKINRKDFGLNWNSALETGGVLVGEEVTITLDVQFIKAA